MTQRDDDREEEGVDDDRELPDESDMDADVEDPTVPCPLCGKPVHDESEICHHCGQYIVQEEKRPGWVFWVATVVAGLMVASMFTWMWTRG